MAKLDSYSSFPSRHYWGDHGTIYDIIKQYSYSKFSVFWPLMNKMCTELSTKVHFYMHVCAVLNYESQVLYPFMLHHTWCKDEGKRVHTVIILIYNMYYKIIFFLESWREHKIIKDTKIYSRWLKLFIWMMNLGLQKQKLGRHWYCWQGDV